MSEGNYFNDDKRSRCSTTASLTRDIALPNAPRYVTPRMLDEKWASTNLIFPPRPPVESVLEKKIKQIISKGTGWTEAGQGYVRVKKRFFFPEVSFCRGLPAGVYLGVSFFVYLLH